MATKSQNERIIFGLKVKQFRQEKSMSFSELSKLAGMSVSYLNEIEKGKKYPKGEKIQFAWQSALSSQRRRSPHSLSPWISHSVKCWAKHD